jgi:iron complex transport system ATP-binding protein
VSELLRTESLAIGYGRTVLAQDLNLTLNPGTLACLIGPNGAGKSTLLRTLSGAQRSLRGHVYIDKRDVQTCPAGALARLIALVLTERVDTGDMLAWEVVALGRQPYTGWSGALSGTDEDIVRDAMRAARCEAFAARRLGELSDGERQRVMIARALAQTTPLIVLDEPTAFLDLPRRIETLALLRELAHEQGKAILLSTHDLELALRYADVLWLKARDSLDVIVDAPDAIRESGALLRAFDGENPEVTRYLRELLATQRH